MGKIGILRMVSSWRSCLKPDQPDLVTLYRTGARICLGDSLPPPSDAFSPITLLNEKREIHAGGAQV